MMLGVGAGGHEAIDRRPTDGRPPAAALHVAEALGAARLGVQGRIAQEGEAAAALQLQRKAAHVLQRKSGARLLWPEGADGWTEHRVRR